MFSGVFQNFAAFWGVLGSFEAFMGIVAGFFRVFLRFFGFLKGF